MSKYGSIVCPDCGQDTPRTSPNMKRCKPCALRAHGQTGEGYAPRACVVCSENYKPTSAQQKACPKCADQFRRAQNVEHLRKLRAKKGAVPVGTMLFCADCGEDFEYTSGPQRRCRPCQRKAAMAASQAALKKSPKLKEYIQKAKDNYSFGGNRRAALERDKFTCQRCGATDDLHVHHIDGLGVTTPRPERNNSLDNLQTLCRGCHTAVHMAQRYGGRH